MTTEGAGQNGDGVGWVSDPWRQARYRWWNGEAWTPDVSGPRRRRTVVIWACVLAAVAAAGLGTLAVGLGMSAAHNPQPLRYGVGLDEAGQPIVVVCGNSGGLERLVLVEGTVQSGGWKGTAEDAADATLSSTGSSRATEVPIDTGAAYRLRGGVETSGTYVVVSLRTPAAVAPTVLEVDFERLQPGTVQTPSGIRDTAEWQRQNRRCPPAE